MTEPVHYSHLKRFAVSPLDYRHGVREDAAHLRKGSATHALTYGNIPVAVYDGKRDKRVKEWTDFQIQHAGSVIVNRKEYNLAAAMSSAVLKSDLVQRLGLLRRPDAVIETEILWTYDDVPFSSTPDLHCPDFGVDLKTTQCAHPRRFERDVMKYQYHAQGAIYKKAIQAEYGYTPKDWYIIAVESKPPHDVVVYKLSEAILALGERSVCGWLSQLRACQGANHWPGYSDAVVEVAPPEWALDDEEAEEETDPEESTEEVAA
jgi:hypothetical protein